MIWILLETKAKEKKIYLLMKVINWIALGIKVILGKNNLLKIKANKIMIHLEIKVTIKIIHIEVRMILSVKKVKREVIPIEVIQNQSNFKI